MTDAVAAIDLGATSGRVILGHVGGGELAIEQVARFPNGPVEVVGAQGDAPELHWDVTKLYGHVLDGLATAVRAEPELRSIAVDAWAVDYGLLRGGRMRGEPFHYRDDRNLAAVDAVHAKVGPEALYAANGLQHLPFNTLFQFTADRIAGRLDGVDEFLLIPDLLTYWLTGVSIAEVTNASTTGLLGVSTHRWDDELIAALDLPHSMFPELADAGTSVGRLLPEVATRLGAAPSLQVSTVGSHDTASAVVAIPAASPDFAYISCGTWGLVGVELDTPVLTEASRLANFTNEGGVDGRVRYLHNVMGLWLLSESVRAWEREDGGASIDLPELIAAATAVTASVPVFDANDPRFLSPGDMPTRIGDWLTERGSPVPSTRAEFVRCIIESLADAFAKAVEDAAALSGTQVRVIHLVGGGSLNTLLCQLTADRSGLPVHAGPVEATAIGNVLIQARAQGLVSGSLEALRALVAQAFPPRLYSPR